MLLYDIHQLITTGIMYRRCYIFNEFTKFYENCTFYRITLCDTSLDQISQFHQSAAVHTARFLKKYQDSYDILEGISERHASLLTTFTS